MKRIALFVAATLILGTLSIQQANALQACNARPFSPQSQFQLFGRPVLLVNEANAPTAIDLVIRDAYEFRNNGDTKLVDWVAYYVDSSTIGNAGGQPNYGNDLCLRPDRTLEADPSSDDDFSGAQALGVSRVHLADPAALANSSNRFDLDLYSNIVPMYSSMVEQWKEFDAAVRAYVLENNERLYIIAGTEYFYEVPNLPGADEPHSVPSGFWKFAYIEGTGERDQYGNTIDPKIKYDGIWFNQADCLSQNQSLIQQCERDHRDWRDRQRRFVDVEARTRFDFNTLLENQDEYESERGLGSGRLRLDEIELGED